MRTARLIHCWGRDELLQNTLCLLLCMYLFTTENPPAGFVPSAGRQRSIKVKRKCSTSSDTGKTKPSFLLKISFNRRTGLSSAGRELLAVDERHGVGSGLAQQHYGQRTTLSKEYASKIRSKTSGNRQCLDHIALPPASSPVFLAITPLAKAPLPQVLPLTGYSASEMRHAPTKSSNTECAISSKVHE